jgi:hypothetical protein
MEVVIVLGLIWLASGVLGRYVALQKGRSAGEGFALGFLFGPLGALIEALLPAAPPPPRKARAGRHLEGWQAPPEDDPDELRALDFINEANKARKRRA